MKTSLADKILNILDDFEKKGAIKVHRKAELKTKLDKVDTDLKTIVDCVYRPDRNLPDSKITC